MLNKQPKNDLTIHLDSELLGKLEFVSTRERRTLANQIVHFLDKCVTEYLSNKRIYELYEKYSNASELSNQAQSEASEEM